MAPQRREPVSCRHCRLQRIKAALGYPGFAPRFTWSRIPTASGDRFHPLLCPHDWFRSLFRERPHWWESSVRGDVGAAERYWDELQESEVLRDHPELVTEDKGWFIPCGLHGDAGQFSHDDSLMVINFNSLIGSGVTKNRQYLITVCKKSDMCPGTLDSLFRVIAWSFNVLQTGIEPAVDWEGKDLMCVFGGKVQSDPNAHSGRLGVPRECLLPAEVEQRCAHVLPLSRHWHGGSRAFLRTLRQRSTLEVHSCDARELEV